MLGYKYSHGEQISFTTEFSKVANRQCRSGHKGAAQS